MNENKFNGVYDTVATSENYWELKSQNQLLIQQIKFLKKVLKSEGYQLSLRGKSAKTWKAVKHEGDEL